MTSQRCTIDHTRIAVKARARRPLPPWCAFSRAGRMVTPRSGVNSTATIHETISETARTTKSVKVNSPALLLFRPTGMKPATVTRVPVSIGKAVEV